MEQPAEERSVVCPNCGDLVANAEVCESCHRPIGSHFGERGYFMDKAIGRIDRPWPFISAVIAIAAASFGCLAVINKSAMAEPAFALAGISAIVVLMAKVKDRIKRRKEN